MSREAAAKKSVERALGMAADFWVPADAVGGIRAVAAADVPAAFRELLDHRSHMTVSLERLHGTPLAVRVLAVRQDVPCGYSREILLIGPRGDVVLYGIVRIDLAAVNPTTAEEIRAAKTPLGRVLIDAGVLRDVRDVSLLEIVPGTRLTELLGNAGGQRKSLGKTFGRVAAIDLDGRPAVELLEIVAPQHGR
jgi:hypothetical protein